MQCRAVQCRALVNTQNWPASTSPPVALIVLLTNGFEESWRRSAAPEGTRASGRRPSRGSSGGGRVSCVLWRHQVGPAPSLPRPHLQALALHPPPSLGFPPPGPRPGKLHVMPPGQPALAGSASQLAASTALAAGWLLAGCRETSWWWRVRVGQQWHTCPCDFLRDWRRGRGSCRHLPPPQIATHGPWPAVASPWTRSTGMTSTWTSSTQTGCSVSSPRVS